MPKLEQFEEIGKKKEAVPEGFFKEREDLIENPRWEGMFQHITEIANEIQKENSKLVKAAISFEGRPDDRKRSFTELKDCRNETKNKMQAALEKLKLISDN